ncbi:MAG: DNA internalization-related competence protein ComEC/Rec2 [Candidatus Scalinduaceae bacterium]
MAHRPLVEIVLSFAIGISADYILNIPFFLVFPTIFVTLLVYLCLFVFYSRLTESFGRVPFLWVVGHGRGPVLTLLFLTFLTGVSYHHFRFYSYPTDSISNLISTKKTPVRLHGIVVSQPISKYMSKPPLSSLKQRKEVVTFLLRTDAIEKGGNISENFVNGAQRGDWKDVSGVIKVNVYPTKEEENTLSSEKDHLANKLEYGDRIELVGNISTPSVPHNPGQFNYKKYLQKQNPRTEAILSVISAKNVKLISENHGNYFFTFVYSLKKKLDEVIRKYVKRRSIPLVSSILLGDREKVPERLMDNFVKTGIIHFLAISGLHVGILVVSLHFLLRLFGLNMRCLAIIIILVTFLYAAITGMKTPIMRASIMVAIYYGAFIFDRRWDILNSIAAAVFIILLINPSDLFNVGFQLSVLAVLGIIYIPDRIENCLWKSTLLIEKLQAKEERNEFWFLFKRYCRKTFCVSLAAWIAVMPLVAYYFHIVTPLVTLLNIVVLPLIWIILVGGFVVLITGFLFPILATPFAWLISYSAITLESIISFLSTNFETFFYTSGLSWTWIAVYYLIVILFIARERLRVRMVHALIVVLAASNIFIISGLFGHNQSCLKFMCFDVRHGTSIFIQFPNGKNMLFDTGTWSNYDVGKFIVAPFLRQEGIRKIDTIVVSHEDDDHCNGIPSLIERFKIDNVYVNKFFLQSGNKEKLLRLISGKNISTGLLAKGVEINGYEPAKITVLNPHDRDILRYEGFPVNGLSVNDSSSVLLIEYLGYKLLLCADIGESGIELILSGKDDLVADIIQVPHHGGFCVKTEDLIKRVKPKHAIISGIEKIVSTSTVEAYEKFGSNLSKTYQDGAISFTINEDGIQVSKFLNKQISN